MARALYHQPLRSPHQPLASGTRTMLRLLPLGDVAESSTRSLRNPPHKNKGTHRGLLFDGFRGESLVLTVPFSPFF